jgi:hypothetical protein
MDTTVEIIGVYPVDAEEPVHIIEILVKNSKDIFDLSEFTQDIHAQPKEGWQVPWDEKLLDIDGRKVVADDLLLSKKHQLWIGDIRIIFFFHYLDFSKALITPFGPVNLPEERPRPERLSQINYESPD